MMFKKSATISQALTRDNWPIWRRWMFRVLLWAIVNAQGIIAGCICSFVASSSSILEQALIALLTLIAAILGSYVFAAVWDDCNKRKFLTDADEGSFGPEPYTPPAQPFTADDKGLN